MKKIIATAVVVFAAAAPVALASGASLKFSHGSSWANAIGPGDKLIITGSVGKGCQVGKKGDVATIYSRGFASKTNYAGIPSVNASLPSSGNFSVKVKVGQNTGPFAVTGRCGGGKFVSAKLHVLTGAY